MSARAPRRLAGFAVLAALTLLVPAAPALAHGGSSSVSDQPYYSSTITAVDKPVPGVSFRVDEHGEWIELTSTAPEAVVVLGYLAEPYLRVTPAGVEENTLSPTVKLNESLFTNALPAGAPPGDHAPVWRRTSDKATVRWHDHRIHWMTADRPPKVAADPVHPQVIGEWTVYVKVGDREPTAVHGRLSWIGKPDDTLGADVIRAMGVTAVLFLIAVAATIWMRRRRSGTLAPEPETAEAARSEPAAERTP